VFTGIIEETAKVVDIAEEGTNKHFWISSSFQPELKIDQSIAHNGVCLTIVEKKEKIYKVTAVAETLKRTNLSIIRVNDLINLERCMPANGRFDGHIVQGHVDNMLSCRSIEDKNGSWVFTFDMPEKENSMLIVEKGSVCLNGVSLTVASVNNTAFSVAIIPYTFEYTNFHLLKPGSMVNVEFDILGKYIYRILGNR